MIPIYPNIVTWTDQLNNVSEVMASHVNQLYAEVIAMESDLINNVKPTSTSNATTVAANTASLLLNSLSVMNYYVNGQTNASTMLSAAVTAAMANGMPYKNIYLPAGLYPIIKPFTIPDGITFIGCGNSSVIQPNYANGIWQGTDYRAVIVRGREGLSALGYYSYNRIVGNFTVTAINAGTVKATGVFFGTDQVITWEQSVTYSVYNATIQNILVEYVDTAFYVQEAWQCNFINISCMYCREGAAVIGKVVNCNFLTNFQNFSMLNATPNTAYGNTSDLTDNSIGIMIDQKTYSDTVGRPEGLVILAGTLVFGAQNNIIVNNVLQILLDGCMFDSAQNECIIVNLPDGFYAHNCYFATNATLASGISCISLLSNQTSAYSKLIFSMCEVVGYPTLGIYSYCGVTANVRFDLNIIDCDFQGFSGPNVMYFNNCHTMSILNNHGHNNKGVFIYNQSYGDNSNVDGNTSEDNYDILHCQPSTSTTFNIGKNSATCFTGGVSVLYNTTYYKGKVTIAASATTATITPFVTLDGTPAYIYPLVKFSVYNDSVHIVNWSYVNTTGVVTFTTATTSASPIVIYCEIMAVPFACF